MRAIAGLLLALVATLAWCGEIYTWKDAGGKVHYSDTPPPGADAKRMRGGASAASASSSAPSKSLAEQDLEFRKRQQDAEKARAKADKEKGESDEASRNCEQAKKQLQALESGQRMSRINEAGENIPLDDETRAGEIEQTRKSVRTWCK